MTLRISSTTYIAETYVYDSLGTIEHMPRIYFPCDIELGTGHVATWLIIKGIIPVHRYIAYCCCTITVWDQEGAMKIKTTYEDRIFALYEPL